MRLLVLSSDTLLIRVSFMAQRSLIVKELKRALREAGYTYGDVALKLRLSLASVKRLFSREDLSLERGGSAC
jgi:hypothetical protein